MENQSFFDELKSKISPNSNNNTNESQSKIKKEDKLKKYYKPESDEENIRVIPFPDGDWYKVVKFHKIKVNGKNKEVLCLNNHDIETDGECPMCKEAKELKLTLPHKYSENLTQEQREENKPILEKIYQHEAINYLVLKVIDRLKIKDGVKFWKIKINRDLKEGAVGFINKAFDKSKEKGALFYDWDNGFDLDIITTEKTLPMDKKIKYREVSLIKLGQQCRVFEDELAYRNIQKDDLTWTDLYSVSKVNNKLSPVEFLELAMVNRTPYWVDERKEWVFPEAENTISQPQENSKIVSEKASQESIKINDDFDDLPF